MAGESKWPNDLIALADWALRKEDLRHQFLHAPNAKKINSSPGIYYSIETTIVLSIYEAGLAKGFIGGKTIDYEREYPSKRKKRGNRKKADLALKDKGKGKNWAYIEVKRYRGDGPTRVNSDIAKLHHQVRIRAQRWILIYRIRSTNGNRKSLEDLLNKNIRKIRDMKSSEFVTVFGNGKSGICEICLVRI